MAQVAAPPCWSATKTGGLHAVAIYKEGRREGGGGGEREWERGMEKLKKEKLSSSNYYCLCCYLSFSLSLSLSPFLALSLSLSPLASSLPLTQLAAHVVTQLQQRLCVCFLHALACPTLIRACFPLPSPCSFRSFHLLLQHVQCLRTDGAAKPHEGINRLRERRRER